MRIVNLPITRITRLSRVDEVKAEIGEWWAEQTFTDRAWFKMTLEGQSIVAQGRFLADEDAVLFKTWWHGNV